MTYKLLATDLDGTLLNDDKKITDENFRALKYAISRGCKVIPCTGRAVQGVTKFRQLTKLTPFAITYNGGMIVDLFNNKIVYHCPLQDDDAKFIIQKGNEYNTNICLWSDNKLYCNKINPYTLDYSKISGVSPIEFKNITELQGKIITKILWYDNEKNIADYLCKMTDEVAKSVNCCTSKPWFLEFFNSKTSKALALEKLGEILDITNNEMIAFGDELNDIDMIKYVKTGVAMANAKHPLKECADYITDNNNENGFATAVYKLL